ncbi:unknown protein [Microcystis aeruginosa NIES-843]|uniref:Uncharacterized protein n=1 Tax=Microcystis aeruginosa (strain NIES-843 / IAM M-2473) TaxID=449447 RepID=B0JTD1_MICAN|nr:unknown protein [Microcystis aeruginosa NIES-843]
MKFDFLFLGEFVGIFSRLFRKDNCVGCHPNTCSIVRVSPAAYSRRADAMCCNSLGSCMSSLVSAKDSHSSLVMRI